jgi:NADPH-dependent 2,4-dienoyl-CoA reductase/sulfur reductase-like enzyme
VTLIHRGSGLFDRLGSPDASDQLASLYREHAVRLLLGEDVAAFAGDGRLGWVETASGLRFEADLAVVGLGVVPNVELLAGTGIALDDGIAVDDRFETTAPGVYAVGDVASVLDPLLGRRRRIEHWSNADYQGTQVGRILRAETAATTSSPRSSARSSA